MGEFGEKMAVMFASFVDGHVSYIQIYWNPGHNITIWYDPPAGYDYQWSAD